jgi:hypothetical protein
MSALISEAVPAQLPASFVSPRMFASALRDLARSSASALRKRSSAACRALPRSPCSGCRQTALAHSATLAPAADDFHNSRSAGVATVATLVEIVRTSSVAQRRDALRNSWQSGRLRGRGGSLPADVPYGQSASAVLCVASVWL